MQHNRSLVPTVGRLTAFSLAVATTFAVGSTARAAELNPSHVPADAKWVLHINQEKLADTKLFQGLRQNQPEIMQTLRDWFKQEYGIDTREDLKSVTMFSRDYKIRNSTAILMTDYNREKVMAELQEHDTLQEKQVDGNTLYVFEIAEDAKLNIGKRDGDDLTDDLQQQKQQKQSADAKSTKKPLKDLRADLRQVAMFLGDGMIIIGSTVENAQAAVQLVEGESKSLEGSKSPLIDAAPEGAMIHLAAIELGNLERFHMLLPVLQQHEQVFYAFGRQQDGQLFEQLTLKAQSEEVAADTVQVLEGIIAYESLAAGDSQALQQVVSNTQLSRDGTTTYVNWAGETGTLIEAIGDLADRVYQWIDLAASTSNTRS